jgi:hypothetical protein
LYCPYCYPNRSLNIPVRLVNINDKPVHLSEGTPLAVLQEVEIPLDPCAATFDVEQRPPPSDGLLHQQPHTTTETDSHVEAIITDLISKVDPSTHDEFKTRLYDLFQKYRHIFSTSDLDIGLIPGIQHCIETGNAPPFRQKLRRHPPEHERAIEQEINKLLTQGVIEPCNSPMRRTLW